jgi:PTS system galactitol-specific IIB component
MPEQEVLDEAARLGVDVFPGVPFLTGMGVDSVYDQIVESTNQ